MVDKLPHDKKRGGAFRENIWKSKVSDKVFLDSSTSKIQMKETLKRKGKVVPL